MPLSGFAFPIGLPNDLYRNNELCPLIILIFRFVATQFEADFSYSMLQLFVWEHLNIAISKFHVFICIELHISNFYIFYFYST